jgi:hypothetical protein
VVLKRSWTGGRKKRSVVLKRSWNPSWIGRPEEGSVVVKPSWNGGPQYGAGVR